VVKLYQRSKQQLTFDTVLADLIQDEHLFALRAKRIQESVAFAASGQSKAPPKTGEGPVQGNLRRKCSHCGRNGHSAERCYKLHPELRPKPSADESNSRRRPPVVFTASHGYRFSNDWLLDSGCEVHVCNSEEYFDSMQPTTGEVVTFGNGGELPVKATGIVSLDCATQSTDNLVSVSDVRFVPGAAANLLSLKRLAQKGYRAVIDDDECLIYSKSDPYTPIMRGLSPDNTGVYVLQLVPGATAAGVKTPSPGVYTASTSVPDFATASLWHRRFGHLGLDNLAKLSRLSMVTDLPVPAADFLALKSTKAPCAPCDSAKQTRVPHPIDPTRATEVLELVHMDLCGPISVRGIGNTSYFLTFLDDFSESSVVRLLSSKSDVADMVIEVLTLLENQTGKSVKAIRSDNGSEFVNATLSAFLRARGILHQRSAPYTPEQNGRAERLNRTLLEKVRAMLADTGVAKSLWPEALVTANYLRNRSPISHSDLTPTELLTSRKPSVSHFRVFGCPVSVKLPAAASKVDPVSVSGIFVGYGLSSVNYRVYIPSLRKVVTSPNVKFYENDSAPPQTPHTPAATVELPPITVDESSVSAPVPPVPAPVSSVSESSAPATVSPVSVPVSPVPVPVSPVPVFQSPVSTYQTPSTPASRHLDMFESVSAASQGDTQSQSQPVASAAAPPDPVSRYPTRERGAPNRFVAGVAVADSECDLVEPQTYEDAMNSPQRDEWIAAMNAEMESLFANQTWELTEVPSGTRVLPVKWLFKIKRGANGEVQRFKARLVAKGFRQREGIDFSEVFAPVSKHATLRTLLSIVAEQDLELDHLDVKTAFLNGELEEEIFMQQPPGFRQGGMNVVCRLKKSLYVTSEDR